VATQVAAEQLVAGRSREVRDPKPSCEPTETGQRAVGVEIIPKAVNIPAR